jgi:AraC-like DNA-binding protein
VLTTILPLAAAGNAALLALALGVRAWGKRSRAGLYAAAFLFGAAAAVTLITLDHAGAPWDPRLIAFGEGVLTLAAGPLLLLFVCRLLTARMPAAILFAPLAAFVIAAAIAPQWAAHAFMVERLVLTQMLYTFAAGVIAWRHKPAGRRSAQARTFALAAVVAMAALHLAQTVRMVWSEVDAIANIVPLVGAGGFVALTGAVYFGGRISALDPLVEAPPAADDAAHALAASFDTALREGLVRDAGLTLAKAARAIGAGPEQLSRALAATRGMSFPEYLQQQRVEETKRLLGDPAEARTSMEAIGLLAGFGSRSAFYKAFGDRVGISPAAYRARNDVQTVQSGQ